MEVATAGAAGRLGLARPGIRVACVQARALKRDRDREGRGDSRHRRGTDEPGGLGSDRDRQGARGARRRRTGAPCGLGRGLGRLLPLPRRPPDRDRRRLHGRSFSRADRSGTRRSWRPVTMPGRRDGDDATAPLQALGPCRRHVVWRVLIWVVPARAHRGLSPSAHADRRRGRRVTGRFVRRAGKRGQLRALLEARQDEGRRQMGMHISWHPTRRRGGSRPDPEHLRPDDRRAGVLDDRVGQGAGGASRVGGLRDDRGPRGVDRLESLVSSNRNCRTYRGNSSLGARHAPGRS